MLLARIFSCSSLPTDFLLDAAACLSPDNSTSPAINQATMEPSISGLSSPRLYWIVIRLILKAPRVDWAHCGQIHQAQYPQ